MSFYDAFRDLPALFVDLGALVPITLQRQNGNSNPGTLFRNTGGITVQGHGALSVVKTTNAAGERVTTTTAKLTVEPKDGDRLTIKGKEFTVVGVSTMQPDGTAIIYEAVLS